MDKTRSTWDITEFPETIKWKKNKLTLASSKDQTHDKTGEKRSRACYVDDVGTRYLADFTSDHKSVISVWKFPFCTGDVGSLIWLILCEGRSKNRDARRDLEAVWRKKWRVR